MEIVRTVIALALLAAAGSAHTLEPVQNIDAARHGNLAAAQIWYAKPMTG
jgi:hypothetical protein